MSESDDSLEMNPIPKVVVKQTKAIKEKKPQSEAQLAHLAKLRNIKASKKAEPQPNVEEEKAPEVEKIVKTVKTVKETPKKEFKDDPFVNWDKYANSLDDKMLMMMTDIKNQIDYVGKKAKKISRRQKDGQIKKDPEPKVHTEVSAPPQHFNDLANQIISGHWR